MTNPKSQDRWMRALVAYVDLDAEGDPDFIAAMDRRWPRALKPSGETKT